MAPFKLKFRMGSSRSTSQEHDSDPQVNEALLNHHQHHSTAIGASSSTIDSTDCTSLGSMGTNERKFLLPNKSNNMRLGYIDHRFTTSNGEASTESIAVPTISPSTYDYMLEELNVNSHDESAINDHRDSVNNPSNSIILSSLEHLELSEEVTIECTDPNCQDNYCNEQLLQQRQQNEFNNFHEFVEQSRIIKQNLRNNEVNNSECEDECEDDNRKESIDSTELLISKRMTSSTTSATNAHETTNLMENCRGDCAQCESGHYNEECNEECNDECNSSGNGNTNRGGNDFFDPLINHGGYCSGESHYNQESGDNQLQDECQGSQYDSDMDGDGGWSQHQQMSNSHSHELQQQQQQQQQSQNYDYEYSSSQQSTKERSVTPEIISNKSSKEIYKDLAKQWGITCKMSDACRCMECQGHYFDCEYDDNEHQKTDGGLGAGTPMFISEVMHGSACNIL